MEPSEITLDSYAEDVDLIRKFFRFEKVAILGHSIHGDMALEYARRYPQNVSHVVVIGSPPVGLGKMSEVGTEYWESHADAERKQVLLDNWNRLSQDSLAKLPPGDAFVAGYITNGPRYWYDATYDASPLWEGMYVNVDVWNRIFELYIEYDLSQGPGQVTSPVFVAMGPYDYVVPHTLWDGQLEKLQSVSYNLFELSGHTPQPEEPELFDQKLIEWFSNM
jgi:proline iminopeptidase